jgi:hypothetical protein
MKWLAYGKQTEIGNQLAVLQTFDVPNPAKTLEHLGDLLEVFDHEPSEEEKDLLLARLDVPIIEEEPV